MRRARSERGAAATSPPPEMVAAPQAARQSSPASARQHPGDCLFRLRWWIIFSLVGDWKLRGHSHI